MYRSAKWRIECRKRERAKARYYAAQANELRTLLNRTENYGMIINYPLLGNPLPKWNNRKRLPMRDDIMMLGTQAAENGDPDEARKQFELAWDEWEKVFEAHPEFVDDAMGDDLLDPILAYKMVLEQLDEEFPRDFKLNSLLEAVGRAIRDLRVLDQDAAGPSAESESNDERRRTTAERSCNRCESRNAGEPDRPSAGEPAEAEAADRRRISGGNDALHPRKMAD